MEVESVVALEIDLYITITMTMNTRWRWYGNRTLGEIDVIHIPHLHVALQTNRAVTLVVG